MKFRIIAGLLLLTSMLVGVSQSQAGSWATVRLINSDEPVVGIPWTGELLVKQHDATPIDVESLIVQFVNIDSGMTIDAVVSKGTEVGEYTVVVTLPEAGTWNWTVTPGMFAPTTMRSLKVAGSVGMIPQNGVEAKLAAGTCLAQLEPVTSYPVTWIVDDAGVSTGVAILPRVDSSLEKSASNSLALMVVGTSDAIQLKACMDIPAFDGIAPIVVTSGEGDDTSPAITLTLLPIAGGVQGSLTVNVAPTNTVIVHILPEGGGIYSPSSLTITAGTTITWINETDIAHTITSLDKTFLNSGVIDPGQQFSQTFASAGRFDYRCDPHNWMTGSVEITA